VPRFQDQPFFSPRLAQAFNLALEMHSRQLRKSTKTPFLAHLMAVASLVMEDGGNEDQSIAALLHDSVEDAGGKVALKRIQAAFGDRVASLVSEVSETDMDPKPPWKERKDLYLAHMEQDSLGALRIAAADKLHNLRSLVRDLHRLGPGILANFNASPQDQIWFFAACLEALSRRHPECIHLDEYQVLLQDLESMSPAPPSLPSP
jgi:(p)ppGpp synthase/HD superfamily hydrolase